MRIVNNGISKTEIRILTNDGILIFSETISKVYGSENHYMISYLDVTPSLHSRINKIILTEQ